LPLFRGADHAFLLDSAAPAGRLGRFSFLGGDPFLVFAARRQRGAPPAAGARVEISRLRDPGLGSGTAGEAPRQERRLGDPFAELRRVLDEFAIPAELPGATPLPLIGGAVGYFGYEAGYFIEHLPDTGVDDLGLPDVTFMLVDTILAHCHLTGRSWLSVCGWGPDDRITRRRAETRRDRWLARLEGFAPEKGRDPAPAVAACPPDAVLAGLPVRAHFDRRSYCRAVARIKEHILGGDVFEVCLTHRLESPLAGSARDLYRELRRINPAPFASFLQLPEAAVVGSSPERFLHLGPDRIAESRPIKGTRPRGATAEQDERLRRELAASEKDRAENVMVVDLVRNDLGRVCRFGTVEVPELFSVEPHATVHQLVSTVRGELAEPWDGLDLIRACFPGGSMTGAPKIEAMKIIDRLEPVKRGIYSGCTGYLDFRGNLDLNIVIRSLVCRGGNCYYNVGGAVVADSDPDAEYQETMDKALALKIALANLRRQRQAEA